jgi:AraC-like DNA-binding protein
MELHELVGRFHHLLPIPMSIYSGNRPAINFSETHFLPDPAYTLITKRLQGDAYKPMDVFISKDCVFCGYIHDGVSGQTLVVGPAAEFPGTIWLARRVLEELGESLARAGELLRFFETAPCMSHTRFIQAMNFLNYVINDEQNEQTFDAPAAPSLPGAGIDDLSARRPIQPEDIQNSAQLCSLIELGKVEELSQVLRHSDFLSGDTNFAANDSLRSIKNIFVLSTAFVSDAAIRGGMSYLVCVSLRDRYMRKMETIGDYNDIILLWHTMMMDFCSRVAKIRRLNVTSKLASSCVGYVHEHIFKKIRVTDMAQSLGYNRTYMCGIFKQETHKNLSEFINEVKTEEAKLLLRTTGRTIVDIADTLGYSSQNYFQSVFRKLTGTTPARYRAVGA